MKISYLSAALLAASTVIACDKNDSPKVPLTPPPAANAGLAGEAKASLDSGNVLFRRHAFNDALAQYQRAAELAPSEAAPLLGILMVADANADARLRETTMARLRKLDPALADSSTMMSHSKIMQAHPKPAQPRT